MALARWQANIVDEEGNVLPSAQVTVRRESAGAPIVSLFTDRDGLVPAGNPVTADGDGYAFFHVAGGSYRIDVVAGAFTRTWRYVAIGTASEFDGTDVVALVQNVDAGYALTFETATSAPPSAGAIRFDNANLGSATQAFVSVLNAAGSSVESRLLELFDATRTVKDTFQISNPETNETASFQIDNAVADGSPASYIILTVSAHDGETTFANGLRVNFQPNRAGADGQDGSVAVSGTFEVDAMVAAESATSIKTTVTQYAGNLDSLASTATKVSMRAVTTGATNVPSGAALAGSYVLTWVWDANAAHQLYIEFATTRVWKRTKASAVWGSWVRLLHDSDVASIADVRAAQAATTSDAQIMTAPLIESASAGVSLTDAATVALDWDAGINFTLVLAGNRALGTPTNAQPGTWRTIRVSGNDATDRSLSFAGYRGGQATLTDIDSGKEYLLTLFSVSSTVVILKATQALP